MKKVLSIALLCAFLVGTVVGCGGDTKKSSPAGAGSGAATPKAGETK